MLDFEAAIIKMQQAVTNMFKTNAKLCLSKKLEDIKKIKWKFYNYSK